MAHREEQLSKLLNQHVEIKKPSVTTTYFNPKQIGIKIDEYRSITNKSSNLHQTSQNFADQAQCSNNLFNSNVDQSRGSSNLTSFMNIQMQKTKTLAKANQIKRRKSAHTRQMNHHKTSDKSKSQTINVEDFSVKQSRMFTHKMMTANAAHQMPIVPGQVFKSISAAHNRVHSRIAQTIQYSKSCTKEKPKITVKKQLRAESRKISVLSPRDKFS